jgi:hypothetical protein
MIGVLIQHEVAMVSLVGPDTLRLEAGGDREGTMGRREGESVAVTLIFTISDDK